MLWHHNLCKGGQYALVLLVLLKELKHITNR